VRCFVVVNSNSTIGSYASNVGSITVQPNAYLSFSTSTPGLTLNALTLSAPSGIRMAPGVSGSLILVANTFTADLHSAIEISAVQLSIGFTWNLVSVPGVNQVILTDASSIGSGAPITFTCPTCPAGGADASTSIVQFVSSPLIERITISSPSPFNFAAQSVAGAQVTFFSCLSAQSLGSLPSNVLLNPTYPCVQGACASYPCQNGATCNAFNSTYSCDCTAGYGGVNCQLNVNECASLPCLNGGQCIDALNSYTCVCGSGFSGVFCQTDLDECASNPCRNSGTCRDGSNGFTCDCVPQYTGPTCNLDANECAVNNGGCGPLSTCTNTFGSFNCSAFIVPGTLSSPDPVASLVPLIMNSFSGITLTFNITTGGSPASDLTMFVGPPSAPYRYQCSGFSFVGGVGPDPYNQPCQCTLPTGFGGPYYLTLRQRGIPVSVSFETVAYAYPHLGANSLAQNRTGYSSDPTSSLLLDTSASVNIMFNGSFFVPANMTVRYGPLPTADRYACTIDVAQSSSSVIVCSTATGSQGSGLVFRVNVGGLETTSQGLFSIDFPVVPIVHRVAGCRNSGNFTLDCNTEGGFQVTIFGVNFLQIGFSVTIGGETCTSPLVLSSTQVTCFAPPGAGGPLRSIIVMCNGQSSSPNPLIGYAGPIILGVSGCLPSPISAVATINCTRLGGTTITLTGLNFGGAGALVLVGSSMAPIVVQDAVTPHRKVVFITPSGTGVDRPILIVPGGGGIAPSNATMSYAECQPGTFVVGLSCQVCDIGKFTAVPSASVCVECPQGTASGLTAGASVCATCDQGTSSDAGASVCTDCVPGKTSSASRRACDLCVAGTFAANNRSSTCEICPVARFQSTSGQSSCELCRPGTFSPGALTSCSSCSSGNFAPNFGTDVCLPCPENSASDPGSSVCRCAAKYFARGNGANMLCVPCPGGAICDAPGMTENALLSRDGYWRADNTTLDFYPCLQTAHCLPGGCSNNRVGPICAVCAPGYSQSSQSAECTPCPSQGASIGGTVGFSLLLVAAVSVVFVIVWRSEAAAVPESSPYKTVKAYTSEHRSPPNFTYNFKILLSYLQIASTLVNLTQIPWPSVFQRFLQALSFVNLNFIPCTFRSAPSFISSHTFCLL
jgi:hypothetical protein